MLLVVTIVFLCFAANAMVSPVVAPLFLHPEHRGIAEWASIEMQTFLVGLALGLGRFGEFLGSPILGELADRFGRRPLMLVVMLGNLVSYLIMAGAISLANVWLLLVGQFINGFVALVLVLAQAEMAHQRKGAWKTHAFGMIFLATSLAYVIAPPIGGHLADPTFAPWTSYELPFLVAAGVCLVDLLLVAIFYWPASSAAYRGSVDLLRGLRGVGAVFADRVLRTFLIINIVIYIGIDFVFQFNPVYYVQTWQFTSGTISWFVSLMSIAMVLAQFIVYPVAQRFSPRVVTSVVGFVLGGLLLWFLTVRSSSWLLFLLPLIGAAMAFATTNMSALISNTAAHQGKGQGQVLGVSHATRVLGSAVICFMGGALAAVNPKLPLLVGALSAVIAGVSLMQDPERRGPIVPEAPLP